MTIGQTQWLAFGLNVVFGLIVASWADFNPFLGVAAMYFWVFPAGVIHALCSLLEGEESRREEAHSYPPVDIAIEAKRIANAGYPEQHRLFMENKLMRAKLRQGELGSTDEAERRQGRIVELETHIAQLQERRDRAMVGAKRKARNEVEAQLAALKQRDPEACGQFDEETVFKVALMRFRLEDGISRSDEPETVTPHHPCSVCGEHIPSCLAECWHCSAVVLAR